MTDIETTSRLSIVEIKAPFKEIPGLYYKGLGAFGPMEEILEARICLLDWAIEIFDRLPEDQKQLCNDSAPGGAVAWAQQLKADILVQKPINTAQYRRIGMTDTRTIWLQMITAIADRQRLAGAIYRRQDLIEMIEG